VRTLCAGNYHRRHDSYRGCRPDPPIPHSIVYYSLGISPQDDSHRNFVFLRIGIGDLSCFKDVHSACALEMMLATTHVAL